MVVYDMEQKKPELLWLEKKPELLWQVNFRLSQTQLENPALLQAVRGQMKGPGTHGVSGRPRARI